MGKKSFGGKQYRPGWYREKVPGWYREKDMAILLGTNQLNWEKKSFGGKQYRPGWYREKVPGWYREKVPVGVVQVPGYVQKSKFENELEKKKLQHKRKNN